MCSGFTIDPKLKSMIRTLKEIDDMGVLKKMRLYNWTIFQIQQ